MRIKHTITTHETKRLLLPLPKTVKFQGSFKYNNAKTYNNLPQQTRNAETFNKFKRAAKRYFKTTKWTWILNVIFISVNMYIMNSVSLKICTFSFNSDISLF